MTFPVTFGLFTNGFTLGFGGLTVSDTVRLFANGDAFGTVLGFTGFVRTLDLEE